VHDFAQEINAYNYSNCQLEIDDKWQTLYGDFTFDDSKFPNMRSFIQSINDLGFRTTLWVIIYKYSLQIYQI
jgi:alpha-glucosidase (family GH31 glycosyl hydrolase)